MKNNYIINSKHFDPMNHPAWNYTDKYLKGLSILEGQDMICAYCSDDTVASRLVFDYKNNIIEEYDSSTREKLADHYTRDLIKLKPMTDFFKGSIFVPILRRFDIVNSFVYSFDLRSQTHDIGSLYFLQNPADPQQLTLYNVVLDIKYPHVVEDKLSIYRDLFHHFDFKIKKNYWNTFVTFENTGSHLDIDYRRSSSDYMDAELKHDLVYQKQLHDDQQTVSLLINYDDQKRANKYVEQMIHVIGQLITSSSPHAFIKHIKMNHYFLHWFKEEEESKPSDNPSK